MKSFLEGMMATHTRKILKFCNNAMYIMSIAMLIAGAVLPLTAKPVAAASGTVWTTDASCGTQDQMAYQELEPIYFNYSNITPGSYGWKITPTNDDTDIVASGSFTALADSSACIYVYTFSVGTAGPYKLTLMDPDGDKLKSDNLKITPAPQPGITIEKTAAAGTFDSVGDVIHYSILVSNSGDVNLTNVVVTDPKVTSLSCPATTLAVGRNMTCTAVHSITQEDLDAGSYTNTASATSDQVGPVTDSVTVTMSQTRTMTVDKAGPANGLYAVGAVLNYTITVTNTGNVTLTGVTVSDSSATVGTCNPANGSSLAPGASMVCAATHVVTQPDIDAGSYLNTATGTSGQLSGSDSVTVTLARNAALTIDKTVVTLPPYSVSGSVTYSIVAKNTGNITLHNVTVADPGVVMGTCSPVSGSSLAPGAEMTCSATHVVTQTEFNSGSYTNTATADSNETSPQTDSETIYFVAGPALEIEKKLSNTGPFVLNDVIPFTIQVTNTGNVPSAA